MSGSDRSVEALREGLALEVELRGQRLSLRTTWGLFSPRAVDAGTQLLLRYLEVAEDDDCCDLGCGYGPIGLVMARLASRGVTTMIDKDFVAVEYARRNAALNGIDNVEVVLSDGLNGVASRRFDVIATNLPAKSGKELYRIMFHDAARALAPGGRFYVVSLSSLRHFVKRELEAAFGSYRKLKTSGQYTLAVASKEQAASGSAQAPPGECGVP